MGEEEDEVPDELSIDCSPDQFDLSTSILANLESIEAVPSNFEVTVIPGTTGPGDYPDPSGNTANV